MVLCLFSRKERKERKGSKPLHNFLALKLLRAKVYEHTMLQFHCFQIIKKLSNMNWQECRNRLKLDNYPFYNQIGNILANHKAIFIYDLNRHLRLHLHSGFGQSVRQTIFVHFFKIPDTKINMQVICYLSEFVTNHVCIKICHHRLL